MYILTSAICVSFASPVFGRMVTQEEGGEGKMKAGRLYDYMQGRRRVATRGCHGVLHELVHSEAR